MNTLQDTRQVQRRRKGQTLAEFAITLPILLILTFGIIEFGRIFQAWVTLQNSARAAVRYASTGQFYDQYDMNFDFYESQTPAESLVTMNDPDGFIPCVDDGLSNDDVTYTWTSSVDQRGASSLYYPNHFGDPDDAITIYNGGLESLFATWNDGKNCDPRSPVDQELRKDMARILSIFEEARKGAGGLALEASSWELPPSKLDITGWPWFEVWDVPNPRETQRGWFDVVVCSNRRPLGGESSESYYSRVDPSGTVAVDTRFVTYLGDQTLRIINPGDPLNGREVNASATSDPRMPQAGCLLNEVIDITDVNGDGKDDNNGILLNAGKPWLDPGGPADTVTVIVTFNHPLVTPLGISPYIKMQARRSAIVEAFRASNLQQAFADVPPLDEIDPTDTPTHTYTPSITFTPTETFTNTPTREPTDVPPTAEPFDCDAINISPTSNGSADGIFGNVVSIDIVNDNNLPTFLTRVVFNWPTIPDFQNMYMAEMALNGSPHWEGVDRQDNNQQFNTTDTNTDSSIPPNYFQNSSELQRTIGAFDSGTWTALLSNGPAQLQNPPYNITINHFAGTTFYLFNPLDPANPCVKPLDLQPPSNPPPIPGNVSRTPTFTPDCASSQVSVRWVGFEQFGIVRLEVVNNRNVVSLLSDFTIQWAQRLPGILTLDRVTTVAPPGQPGSIEVWHADSASQDSTPPTGGRTEGTWVQNFTFPPQSITPLFIDFGGVAGLLSGSGIGMNASNFNGSQFRIGCGANGTGGGTGGASGLITLDNQPPPPPTNTRGPSNTPRPTYTPSKTFTPGPPTKTPTRGPTPTTRPSSTPRPPPTATTPPPPPTLPGGGCVDGCG